MKHKYGAVKTTIDGINFDSKAEAARYEHLKLLESAGKIDFLELQPKYELQPRFKKNGKTEKSIVYIPDFKYYDHERKKWVIEDVKGYRTKEFNIKRKLFEYRYPDLTLEVI